MRCTTMSIPSRSTRRGGFSLLEVLVVVVLLGVIIVAAIPAINRYLPRYRLARTAENLTQAAAGRQARCRHPTLQTMC